MTWILQYLPIGIFAIIAKTIGIQGLDKLTSLGSMVGVFYLAIIAQLLFYTLILVVYRVNLREFFINVRTPILTAFITQSCSGTLPLTLNTAGKLKLDQGRYGFSLPLGATINMDGAGVIMIATVFSQAGLPIEAVD